MHELFKSMVGDLLELRRASRLTIDMTDSRRSRPIRGHSKSGIFLMESPSIELDGAPKSMDGFCPSFLEGGTSRALLFLILTIMGW